MEINVTSMGKFDFHTGRDAAVPGAPRGEPGFGGRDRERRRAGGWRDRRSSKDWGEENSGDCAPRRTARKRPGSVRGSVGPLSSGVSGGVTERTTGSDRRL